MNLRSLLMTTILSTSVLVSFTPASFAADNITTGTVKTATSPIAKATLTNPSLAATSFIEHVNFARVALAMRNVELAKQHIDKARSMENIIKSASSEARHIERIESGRIVYSYDTEYKYHYFPIQTGPVQVKQVSNGPIWATNDLAVTDADIVYLTLNLTGDVSSKYLDASTAAIDKKDFKEADAQLAKLTDAVVTVDSKTAMPGDKARDNIALAHNFIAGKNYAGASFALKHADDALNEMLTDVNYEMHRANIVLMRKDVSDMQNYIAKKDPDMIDKADTKLNNWWDQMKAWSKESAK